MNRSFLRLLQLIFPIFFSFFSTFSVIAGNVEIEKITMLRNLADSLHSVGKTDSAVIVGKEALRLAQESGNPTQIVGTNSAQGVFLRSLGDIKGAVEHYEAGLAIITSDKFRDNPDQEAIEEIASLYINLSVLNLDTQHKEQAAENSKLAAQWIAKSNDPELRGTIYGVAGSVLTGCGELSEAKHLQGLAYKEALETDDKEGAFRAAAYTMLVADRSGEKKEAEEWREKCTSLLPEIESMMAKLVYYQAECSISLKNNQQGNALHWFNEILKLDGIENLPFVQFDCYNNMHLTYSEMGDYKNAYGTLLKSNELRDSLWKAEKEESLRDLNIKYQTKETELALAQSESRRAKTLMWLFAALGLLLAAGVLFTFYVGRERRRRAEKEMEFARLREETSRQLTREYVEGLENERRRMSRELHDGVCNDLLGIQMNIRNDKPLDSTLKLIDSCRESVRRISHELLPPEFAYADIDEVLRYYVGKQSEANSGKIDITYSSSSSGEDWMNVPEKVSLEIYRIVQEALGNALKHSGASDISVKMNFSDGELTAEVKDNGHFTKLKGQGIGVESMKRRAEAIGGYIEICQPKEGGTAVKLTVSLHIKQTN